MAAASSASPFIVRAPQPGDLSQLRATLPEWTPAAVNESPHAFRVLVQRTGGGNEEPAGIAEFQQVVDEGTLLGIAIAPAFQRRGLGLQLLEAVLAELRAQGCARCLLEVRRSNTAAQALYRRAGFALDGVRKDYYPAQDARQREDALLYSRPL